MSTDARGKERRAPENQRDVRQIGGMAGGLFSAYQSRIQWRTHRHAKQLYGVMFIWDFVMVGTLSLSCRCLFFIYFFWVPSFLFLGYLWLPPYPECNPPPPPAPTVVYLEPAPAVEPEIDPPPPPAPTVVNVNVDVDVPQPVAPPTVVGPLPVDTTGDGVLDSIIVDTTGDGRPDFVMAKPAWHQG